MRRKIITFLCFLLMVLSCLFVDNAKKVDAYNLANYYDKEPKTEYAYSFAVIGDTQYLSLYHPESMKGIYDWVVANVKDKKIEHVFGLGDITEYWEKFNDLSEWTRAKQYISQLDGVVPYSLVRGNHDETINFNNTFNYPAYTNQFDGFFEEGDLTTSYKTLKAGSTDYLLITLDYGATDEELEWAGEVINEHPYHKVIVTTHGYLNESGSTLGPGTNPSVYPAYKSDINNMYKYKPNKVYNDGQDLWDKFFSQYANIELVMCGHIPSEYIVTTKSKGVHGNTVTQMLINPQYMDRDDSKAGGKGTGMVCMLYFNEDGSQMDVEFYSTVKNQYYIKSNELSINLTDSGEAAHNYTYLYNDQYHWLGCEDGCDVCLDEDKHTWNENNTCVCGATKKLDSANLGCMGSIVTSLFGIISLAAITLFVRKKQN